MLSSLAFIFCAHSLNSMDFLSKAYKRVTTQNSNEGKVNNYSREARPLIIRQRSIWKKIRQLYIDSLDTSKYYENL